MSDAPETPLDRCVRILSGKSAVARVVGVKPQSAIELINRGGRPPAEWCIPLEKATAAAGEIVRRGELRPDIYPEESTQPVASAA